MATVSEGVQAPDFKLTSTSDDTFSLMERRGSANLVLLFLDSASGGTDTQIAASFRDASEVFAAERTTVVGIAKATLDDLKAFQTTHSLPFELLSDDGAVAAAYGVRVRQGFGPISRERFRRSFGPISRERFRRSTFLHRRRPPHLSRRRPARTRQRRAGSARH